MLNNLSLLMIFAAGLLSFLSPCVLPLIPSYFSILGGVGLEKNTDKSPVESHKHRTRLVQTAAAFVFGFSVVFIALGLLVNAAFFFMSGITLYINWAAGIIVIVLGLNIIFDFISFLNYEKRPFFKGFASSPSGFRAIAAAGIAGAAFATGWTPCIGPILTGILIMASQSGKTWIAAFYLMVYSAGLGIPFLLTGLFFDLFLKHASWLRSHLPLIRRISGILLICIGIMILTGRYSALNGVIQRLVFAYIDGAETRALPFRLLANGLSWIMSF
jgi:cytochrome c-type biogenesis protein